MACGLLRYNFCVRGCTALHIFVLFLVEVSCTTDRHCPSRHACVSGQCVNPCELAEPCGANAECTVLDTLPVRTMTCVCLTGYEGDAALGCTPVKTCPAGRGLVLNEREECVCPPGHALDPDDGVTCIPCRRDLGFVVDLRGRCVCDKERGLVYDVTTGGCVCPSGYFLNDSGYCEEGECNLIPVPSSGSTKQKLTLLPEFSTLAMSDTGVLAFWLIVLNATSRARVPSRSRLQHPALLRIEQLHVRRPLRSRPLRTFRLWRSHQPQMRMHLHRRIHGIHKESWMR